MFKLLTDEERQKVAHEYVLRRTIVMLLALILVFITGIIGLLPSYVLSNARQNEVLERSRIMDSIGEKGDESELRAWLVETNRELRLLSPALDTDRPSDLIDKIIAERLAGMRIKGLSWAKVKGEIILSVSGIALNRQVLIEFENRLNSSGHFSAVSLPVSNLVRDKDIDFQVKLSPARTTEAVQSGGPAKKP